jgi:hypothetical protein
MDREVTITTRITCDCRVCSTNATRLGRTELAAEITAAGITRLGGHLTPAGIHGVVHAANHPQLGRALVAHRSAYWSAP